VHVSIVPALYQVLGSSVTVDSVDGSAVFGLKSFRLTRSSFFVKRLFDSIGACLILLVGAPVMAAIALAIRFDSSGPVLFRQRRIGRDGREFIVFKFRTMVANAEVLKVNLEARNEAADGFFKIREDPRITRVGRLLRRSSLDELPQLLNVLRGEMSLVGPRPLIPEEDARVEGWHRRRLELMPGMTGPWQVLGSSRVPLREMVALDYLYVAHWTLWTDIKLMLRTVPHVLASRSQ
jgi:lipopolysaccharide/colanic/teichoic acid biosynthesis glycosyltransferase